MCKGQGIQVQLSCNLESNHMKFKRIRNYKHTEKISASPAKTYMNEHCKPWDPFAQPFCGSQF